MHDYQCVAHHEARGCDQYISVQLGLRNVNEVQLAVTADTSPLRGLPAREIFDVTGHDGMST